MNTSTRTCRVCGKEYKYCRTARQDNAFRWQDVSCSRECGAIYLARVLESRRKPDNTNDNIVTKNADDNIDSYTEDYDEDVYDDYYEDEESEDFYDYDDAEDDEID